MSRVFLRWFLMGWKPMPQVRLVWRVVVPVIEHSIFIEATPLAVFNLARSVEAHLATTGGSGERAVAGVTHGLIGLGERVTWEAVHFGVRQRLTAEITEMEEPHRFVDVMVPGEGAFKWFRHVHEFEAVEGGTVMRDRFEYESPLGWLGRVADVVFLRAYMARFIARRAAGLKGLAERMEKWPKYLGNQCIKRWTRLDFLERLYLVRRADGLFTYEFYYVYSERYEYGWEPAGLGSSYFDTAETAIRELKLMFPWMQVVEPEMPLID